MQSLAGAYGNSNWDEYLSTTTVTHLNGTLSFELLDQSRHALAVPEEPSKITLSLIPERFQQNVSKRRAGGGAVNSRLAAESIKEQLGEIGEIRFLDANGSDAPTSSQFPSPVRHLSLRACPSNYVLGTREDKWIFRSPIQPAGPIGPKEFDDIVWLCEARTILLNGPKDQGPVEAILAAQGRRGFELILMLTPSLPATFLERVALPTADMVIGAWDDLQFLTGSSPLTVVGAACTAMRLREMAPRAEIHVTMGRRGVLSVAADSAEAVHVELTVSGEVAADAREIVQERPARLCGAGDAFAGGVLMRRAFGWSLLPGVGAFPSHVGNALVGCASALRWIGVSSDLALSAFDICSHQIPLAA